MKHGGITGSSISFFGALSSILLYRNACTEDSSFFVADTSGVVYGAAVVETNLFHKHHLQIYQYLITITGCAYFWIDKEIGNSYNKQYAADEFSETAVDRLSLALYASGYRYESMDKKTEANVLFSGLCKNSMKAAKTYGAMEKLRWKYAGISLTKAVGRHILKNKLATTNERWPLILGMVLA